MSANKPMGCQTKQTTWDYETVAVNNVIDCVQRENTVALSLQNESVLSITWIIKHI